MPPKFLLTNSCLRGPSPARNTQRIGAPLQAPSRPTAPLARNLTLRHGRWVRRTIPKRKPARLRTATRSISQDANKDPRQKSLKESFHQSPVGGSTTAPTSKDYRGPGSDNIMCEAECRDEVQLGRAEASFLEKVKNDIDTGLLDLKGDPWVRPCDPHVEAIKINSSRRQAATQALNEAEVQDLVFRPAVFVWVPHLLPLWPFDLYSGYVHPCVCCSLFIESAPSVVSLVLAVWLCFGLLGLI